MGLSGGSCPEVRHLGRDDPLFYGKGKGKERGGAVRVGSGVFKSRDGTRSSNPDTPPLPPSVLTSTRPSRGSPPPPLDFQRKRLISLLKNPEPLQPLSRLGPTDL